jgi:hypothetical protein
MDDATTYDADDDGGWTVAGVLTDLDGAVLTTMPAEAGLAGTMLLDDVLSRAANDDRCDGATPRVGRARLTLESSSREGQRDPERDHRVDSEHERMT